MGAREDSEQCIPPSVRWQPRIDWRVLGFCVVGWRTATRKAKRGQLSETGKPDSEPAKENDREDA